ncbi:hypothetical protein [Paraburkholderia sp. GAS42]|uniref:hypothetical protein n=1 Tax=Paraburkholderia sp. GAS42 TaxID=3035135 RepID=UPI003D1E7339
MNTIQLVNGDLPYPSQGSQPSKLEIDELCMILFNRWCERRSVTPLAYLMHSWPMPSRASHVIRRLSETLKELEMSHADSLTFEERRLLAKLVDLTAQPLFANSRSEPRI